jgi:hypothetical protein
MAAAVVIGIVLCDFGAGGAAAQMSEPVAQYASDVPVADTVDATFRVLFALLVGLIVPVYYVKYGPSNFLWFSDIGLFGICLALWLEHALLGSMMALALLVPESLWHASFIAGFFRRNATTLSSYMFDRRIPLYLRGLSLFHLALPPALIWLLYRYGYDERALAAQTVLAWLVLPATFLWAPPEKNLNWVRGFGHPPRKILSERLHLALMMLAYPLLVYLPTHYLLAWLFG